MTWAALSSAANSAKSGHIFASPRLFARRVLFSPLRGCAALGLAIATPMSGDPIAPFLDISIFVRQQGFSGLRIRSGVDSEQTDSDADVRVGNRASRICVPASQHSLYELPSLSGRKCPVRGTLSTCGTSPRTMQARNVSCPDPLTDPLPAAHRPRQRIRVISRHMHLVSLKSSLPGACQQSPRTRLSLWKRHASIPRTLPAPHLESAATAGCWKVMRAFVI